MKILYQEFSKVTIFNFLELVTLTEHYPTFTFTSCCGSCYKDRRPSFTGRTDSSQIAFRAIVWGRFGVSSTMLRLPAARAKTSVHFFAEGMLPTLVTRHNQPRGVHFAIKSSLKSKVKTCSALCSASSDVRPSQQCCSTFQSAGNASSLFQRSSFHGFHQFKSLQTKCPSQGLYFHCEFRTSHSANRRAFLRLGSDTRHKSYDASQSEKQGKDTVSTSAWQWNRQSKFGPGGHGYVILVTAAVVGTAVAVYILSSYKNRYNSNDSRWQAELESLEKNDGLEMLGKIKSLSLQEAVAQATDLCQRVKVGQGSVVYHFSKKACVNCNGTFSSVIWKQSSYNYR